MNSPVGQVLPILETHGDTIHPWRFCYWLVLDNPMPVSRLLWDFYHQNMRISAKRMQLF